MGKVTVAPLTDEVIRKASEAGEQTARAPGALARARVERASGALKLNLLFNDGTGVAIPIPMIGELAHAKPAQLRTVIISPFRDAISFPSLDVDIYVPGLLADVYGPIVRSELGRHAGRRSSPKKAAAVRENGRKGGRPRSVVS